MGRKHWAVAIREKGRCFRVLSTSIRGLFCTNISTSMLPVKKRSTCLPKGGGSLCLLCYLLSFLFLPHEKPTTVDAAS